MKEAGSWSHVRARGNCAKFLRSAAGGISEALALKSRDVDWLKSTLTVSRSVVDGRVDDVKTPESATAFLLSRELLLQLHLWRQLTEFAAESDWIFASPVKIGRLPYSYTGARRALKAAAKKADLGWIGTHIFRHTYRAWMTSFGTDLEVQKRAMRHTDIRTNGLRRSFGRQSE